MFSIRANILLAGVLSMGSLVQPARAQNEVVLYAFQGGSDAAEPFGGMIKVKGALYGTTISNGYTGSGGSSGSWLGSGTVFKITTAGVETVLHAFQGSPNDGVRPWAGLVDVVGTLYGTTEYGGANNAGTVFKITTAGAEKVLHSFGNGNDGAYPYAGLINVGGTLYGTTTYGGSGSCTYGCGTVFKITTKGVETVLYSFKGGNDGAYPRAALIDVAGTLYGTTEYGGANNAGTVFKITTAGAEKVLHSFGNGNDGAYPYAGLIDVGGTLYGTTYNGGTGSCTYGCGTVFKITMKGVETVLYSFKGGSDGANPWAGLIDVAGTLYGTTENGGGGGTSCTYACGTVFKITTAGVETVLHAFQGGSDGSFPGPLIDLGGTIYGTTQKGGGSGGGNCTQGCGTVFKVTP